MLSRTGWSFLVVLASAGLAVGIGSRLVEDAPPATTQSASILPVTQLFQRHSDKPMAPGTIEQDRIEKRRTSTAVLLDAPLPELVWLLTVLPDAHPLDVFLIEVKRTQVSARLKAYDPVNQLALLEMPMVEGVEKRSLDALPVSPLPPAAFSVFSRESAYGRPGIPGKLALLEATDADNPRVWRLHAELTEGTQGAPVQDAAGKTLGIIWRPAPGNNAHFVYPLQSVNAFLQDVRSYGKPVERWLGTLFEETSRVPILVGVTPESPAAIAGLQPGDVLLSVAGRRILEIQDLVEVRPLLPLDRPVEVKLLRGVEEVTVQLTPRRKVRQTPA